MASRTAKRIKLDPELTGPRHVVEEGFSINAIYARKYEYNQNSAHRRRLEAKYGKDHLFGEDHSASQDTARNHSEEPGQGSSSLSEDEDDAGDLATEQLDREILETLAALKRRDAKIYNRETQFYADDHERHQSREAASLDKPVYLRDYHRHVIMDQVAGDSNGEVDLGLVSRSPPTSQRGSKLRNELIKSIHQLEKGEESESQSEGEADGLLKPRVKSDSTSGSGAKELGQWMVSDSALTKVGNIEEDPDRFLADFLVKRAWVPRQTDVAYLPLESDDSADEQRAEDFEAAYNLRFEDPSIANERLRTHDRTVAAVHSARREELNSRKRNRELKTASKRAARKEEHDERKRLRKFRREELQDRLHQISQAAGVKAQRLEQDDWAAVLKASWEGRDWESVMQKLFDDAYYDRCSDIDASSDDQVTDNVQAKKPKKPRWADDIPVDDLISEGASNVGLESKREDPTSVEGERQQRVSSSGKRAERGRTRGKLSVHMLKAADTVADSEPPITLAMNSLRDQSRADEPDQPELATASFSYREGSPQSFGLTAKEILLADDKHLNLFAGLKTLGHWRSEERKDRDQRKISKKGRLSKWRRETFGS